MYTIIFFSNWETHMNIYTRSMVLTASNRMFVPDDHVKKWRTRSSRVGWPRLPSVTCGGSTGVIEAADARTTRSEGEYEDTQ